MLSAWVTAYGPMHKETPRRVALPKVFARYYQHRASKQRSAADARIALGKWLDFFGVALVSEVTRDRQRAFVAHLREQGKADGYIRRILAVGAAALNRAVKEGEIESAPRIVLEDVPEGEPRDRVATVYEGRLLFRAAEDTPHIWLFLMLAFGTGGRKEALLELTTFQCDFQTRTIHLNPPGRRQNKKRRASVPMIEPLARILSALPPGPVVAWHGHPVRSIKTAFNKVRQRARLLARQDGAKRSRDLLAKGLRDEARIAVAEAKAQGEAVLEICPHVIRHTVGTEMRRRDVMLDQVAGFLGHSSGYRTTERYAKIGPDTLAGAARALEAYFADLGLSDVGTPEANDRILNQPACELRAS